MTLLILFFSSVLLYTITYIHDDDAIDCTAKYNWRKGAWEISSATEWNKRHGITCAYTCPIELERECIKNINWIKRKKKQMMMMMMMMRSLCLYTNLLNNIQHTQEKRMCVVVWLKKRGKVIYTQQMMWRHSKQQYKLSRLWTQRHCSTQQRTYIDTEFLYKYKRYMQIYSWDGVPSPFL